MVQPVASLQGPIASAEKPIQHRTNARGTRRPGQRQRPGARGSDQCAIALRGGGQTRSKRRTGESKPRGSEEEDRTAETETEGFADTASAAERQETGQERS